MEVKDTFPPMNGEYAPDFDADLYADLENHLVDYCIGRYVIYASFAWSEAEEAYELTRSLAKKHEVGFFDVSGEEFFVVFPDGTTIK